MHLINYLIILSLATTLTVNNVNALPLGTVVVAPHTRADGHDVNTIENGIKTHRRFGLFWPGRHSPFEINGRDGGQEAVSTDSLIQTRQVRESDGASNTNGKRGEKQSPHTHRRDKDDVHLRVRSPDVNSADEANALVRVLPRFSSLLKGFGIGQTKITHFKKRQGATSHLHPLPRFSSALKSWVIGKPSLAVDVGTQEKQIRRSDGVQVDDSKSIRRANGSDGFQLIDRDETIIKLKDGTKLVARHERGGEGGKGRHGVA